MLSCRDVTNRSDEFMDKSLGLKQRLAVVLHLLICVHCRRYLRQLRALIGAVPFMHAKASDEQVDNIMATINKHKGSNQK